VSETRSPNGVSDSTFGREPSQDPSPPRSAQDGPISYELATWSVRAGAFLIDLLLLAAVGAAIGIGVFLAEGDTEDARRLAQSLALAIGVPVGLLYAPLLMMRRGERNGQTLGKQALRIRVVREGGEPVTLGNGLLREAIGRQLLVAFTYGLYALIDYLWPTWDRARQCLHDKVAQTRVVRVDVLRAGDPGAWTVGQPEQGAPRPDPAGPAPAPPPPPRRPEDDAPVRGWLPPSSGS
jgi:uncharacterized RDD family membrane protein YckC